LSTDVFIPRAVTRRPKVSGTVLALAGLVGSAGVIHVVAAIEHVAEDWYLGVFFVLVGAVQLLAAWWIYRRPMDRRVLTAAALGGVAVALLWIFSRTTGIPFGPEAGKVSKVGVADTIATLQQLAFAAIVAALLWRPERGGRRLPWLSGSMAARLTPALLSASLLIAALGGHEH